MLWLDFCAGEFHVLFDFFYAGGFFLLHFFVQEDLSGSNGFYPPQLRLLMYVIGGREVGQVLTNSIYFMHCPNKLS